MKSRKFNAYMPHVNEKWVSRVLNIPWNENEGHDLIDETRLAEVKFLLTHSPNQTKYAEGWTVQDHQLAGGKMRQNAFWALGIYRLSKPVSLIESKKEKSLELLVDHRELYVVTWDWMGKYSASVTKSGNTFRYPKFHELPKRTSEFEVDKGVVYLTEGVPEDMFRINGTRREELATTPQELL